MGTDYLRQTHARENEIGNLPGRALHDPLRAVSGGCGRPDDLIGPAPVRIDRAAFRNMQSFAQQVFLRGSSGYTVPVVSTRKTSVFLAGERYPDEPGQGYSRSELHPGLPVAGRLHSGAGPDSLEVICDVPRSSTYFPPPFSPFAAFAPLFSPQEAAGATIPTQAGPIMARGGGISQARSVRTRPQHRHVPAQVLDLTA